MDDFDIIVGGSLNGYFCHFKCKIAVQPRIYYIVAGHTPALGAYPFNKQGIAETAKTNGPTCDNMFIQKI